MSFNELLLFYVQEKISFEPNTACQVSRLKPVADQLSFSHFFFLNPHINASDLASFSKIRNIKSI